jgi:hypothetical protein
VLSGISQLKAGEYTAWASWSAPVTQCHYALLGARNPWGIVVIASSRSGQLSSVNALDLSAVRICSLPW